MGLRGRLAGLEPGGEQVDHRLGSDQISQDSIGSQALELLSPEAAGRYQQTVGTCGLGALVVAWRVADDPGILG